MNSRRVGVIVKRGGLDHGIRTMFLYSCDVKRNDGYLVCSQDVAKFRVGDWIEFVCDATENYFAGKRISEPFRTTADGFELVRAHVRATIFRGVMPVRIGYLCWSPELRYVYIAKDKIASMRQDCLYDVVVTFAINAPSFKVDGKEVYVYWQIEDVVGESADSRAMNEVPWMVKSKVASENTDNTTATASLTETSSTQEKNVKTQPTVDQVEAKKGQGSQWESSDEEKEEPEEEGHFLMIEGQYKAYTRNLSYKLNKNLDLLNTNYNPKPSEKPKNMDEKEEPVGLTMLERERVWSCLREELLENDPNSPIIAKIEARRASFYDGKKGKDFSD